MRKIMMLAAMLALVAVIAVVPALADDNDDNGLIHFDDCFPFCDYDNGDDHDGDDNGDDHNGDDNGDDHNGDDNGDDHNGDDNGGGFEITQEIGQEAVSGDVELSNEVSNSGDNSNVCAPALQFANTGNLQNAQGFAQYGSETGDIEFGGSAFVFEPSLEASCDQSIEQSATAFSY